MPRVITALDIGSSTIKAASCLVDRSGKISLLHLGSHSSKGVQSGSITDFKVASSDIGDVLERQENSVKKRIRSVSLTAGGPGIEAVESSGLIPLGKKSRQILRHDVRMAVKVASMLKLPQDRQSIGEAVEYFFINESEPLANPVGLHATKLGVKLYQISAYTSKIKDLCRIVEDTGRIVENVVAEPVAVSEAVFIDKHRQAVTALIDIGSHTAQAALFKNDCIKGIWSLEAGSKVLKENDNTCYAERVKALFGDHGVNHVILTGGGALENDMVETFEKVFNVPCEIGRVRLKWCNLDPSESIMHTSTLGLVNFEAKRLLSGYELENPLIKLKQFVNNLLDEYF